jgi:hypothetical protein
MNAKVTDFPEEVARSVGNYVYRLIDPRNGETFYVGKGRGNRVFQHVQAADIESLEDEDAVSLKMSRIRAIRGAGLNVIHVIHRHEIPDEAVNEVEAALIDAFPGLSNIQGGHGSGSKGPMSATEIMDKFALPTISEDGPHISIRKQSTDPMTPVDLVDAGSMSTELVALLWLLYEHHGVVHERADRDRHSAQRHRVDRNIEKLQYKDGKDKRHRNGRERDHRGSPVDQKQHQDNHNQNCPVAQSFRHVANGQTYKVSLSE